MAAKNQRRSRGRFDLGTRPGFLIRRLHQIHTSLFQEACQRFGVTPVQYSVMTILQRNGVADQVTIAAEAGIDRANTTDVVRRLEQRKLVVREASAEDSRAKLCRLTARGRRLAATMERAVQGVHFRTISALPPADRARFLVYLRRLVDANNHLGRTRLSLK